jgi:hypothetical protein
VTEASGKVKNRDLGGTIVSIWGYLRPVWCTIISGGCGGCAVVMMYVCVYYTTKNLPMSVARVTQGKGQRSSAADVCNILVACIEMLPRICLRNKHLLTRSPNPPPRHRPLTTTAPSSPPPRILGTGELKPSTPLSAPSPPWYKQPRFRRGLVNILLLGSFANSAAIILSYKSQQREISWLAKERIQTLRETIERVRRGEDIDVRAVLGTGDPEMERRWDDCMDPLN